MTISNQVLTSKDSFKQLDLLYEIYKLRRQKDLLSKKLNILIRLIKNSVNNNVLAKLKALRIIIDEINRKEELVTSKLLNSFDFFHILQKVKELNYYIFNINKALRKKQIDVNTYRLTKEYYQKQLKVHMENLYKIKMITKEYIIILKNKVLQIKVEEKFQKSTKLNTPNKQIHEKVELTRFIEFLNKFICER